MILYRFKWPQKVSFFLNYVNMSLIIIE